MIGRGTQGKGTIESSRRNRLLPRLSVYLFFGVSFGRFAVKDGYPKRKRGLSAPVASPSDFPCFEQGGTKFERTLDLTLGSSPYSQMGEA